MRRLTCLWLAPALLLASVSASATEEPSDHDYFQLWGACARVSLEVGDLPKDATEIGLRKEDIETAVRSRLRAARLYLDINAAPTLAVFVHVHGSAYSVDVEFWKFVEDETTWSKMPKGLNRLHGFAPTWEKGALGTHGGDYSYVLSAVGRYADKFIDEYLRVNEDACK